MRGDAAYSTSAIETEERAMASFATQLARFNAVLATSTRTPLLNMYLRRLYYWRRVSSTTMRPYTAETRIAQCKDLV